MKRYIFPLLLLILLLLTGSAAAEQEAFTVKRDAVSGVETKSYETADGCSITMSRISGSRDGYSVYEFDRPEGMVYTGGGWKPLKAGTYTGTVIGFTFPDAQDLMVVTPKTFLPQEYGTVVHLPEEDGFVRVDRGTAGWHITVGTGEISGKRFADALALTLPEGAAFPREGESCASVWEGYASPGTALWCFDGYYRAEPAAYYPKGNGNNYYRCPASYLISVLHEEAAGTPGEAALFSAMLDTVAEAQNAMGYWESSPKSLWLFEEYDIPAGFYDTRFNTDLAMLYLDACKGAGGARFLEPLNRYLDFFLEYAETNRFSAGEDGWLIPDYWHRKAHRRTHTSLNHQAAECTLLYEASEVLHREELAELGDHLLAGLEQTGTRWIMENDDLYYRIQPDGSFVSGDYPFLTYNDLFTLRKLLNRRAHSTGDVLDRLMQSKKCWMDLNGITGYDKS